MRYAVILISLASWVLAITWTPVTATADPAERRRLCSERIVKENRAPGATDWQLTRVRLDQDGFRSPWIEGYCSRQSAEAGEIIEIMVSTNPPQPFQLEVYRMGYYGGRGARLMKTVGPLQGITQPGPQAGQKNLHECNWKPST